MECGTMSPSHELQLAVHSDGEEGRSLFGSCMLLQWSLPIKMGRKEGEREEAGGGGGGRILKGNEEGKKRKA